MEGEGGERRGLDIVSVALKGQSELGIKQDIDSRQRRAGHGSADTIDLLLLYVNSMSISSDKSASGSRTES